MVQDSHVVLHTTNKKYHMAYRFVPISMTLDDLEGHSLVQDLSNAIHRHFARFQLTLRDARSLGDI